MRKSSLLLCEGMREANFLISMFFCCTKVCNTVVIFTLNRYFYPTTSTVHLLVVSVSDDTYQWPSLSLLDSSHLVYVAHHTTSVPSGVYCVVAYVRAKYVPGIY